jgi:type I restriction-modification system DNA methylase subunit
VKIIEDFVGKVIATRGTGAATEHSYRPALLDLFNALEEGVVALNEPKRVGCGAPDFIIQRGEIAIGHVEAKDIGVGLRALKDRNKEQQDRYRKALPNLIYTNCFDWDFYRDGELIASAGIADCRETIRPKPDQYEPLANLLRDFIAQRPRTIVSPRVLAEMMAGKAQLIKDILRNTLRADENLETELTGQFRAFQEHLIHDITPEDFADIYAETIAYGMFAARLHDTSLETFSRQEALDLLPKTNPFLRSLFGFIAGVELDDRIAWIIDELAAVFQAADVAEIMKGFGRLTGRNDPFLHFYETFLAAYNPAKRKARGVWYTPEPVVNFIVRAVDEVLRTEFGLPDGLADTSKVAIDFDTGQNRGKGGQKPSRRSKEVHRVQILDPATGTGTFLAEAIKQIAPKVKDVAPGMWSKYVETELIPRLHGFELLMASYAMCHMKLDMILNELGYEPADNPPRLSVYLTNSLEEGEREVRDLFMTQWLTREAREANTIKRDMPIMCVIGNPPYLGEGGKSTGWLGTLMDDYKKEPGGKVKLKERNPKWLNDLYVKFIRLSSHLIERNGEGVLGFITNHGYLDNPTFRGMRWHLLKTFDKIWVLDLHGNAKKKEVTPEGKPDRNVFDIQQGVAIIIGVKKKDGGKELAEVMQGDLWGERSGKYAALEGTSLTAPLFSKLESPAPQHPFVKRDYSEFEKYRDGVLISELMPTHGNGIVTKRDRLNIHHSREGVVQLVKDFISLNEHELRKKYGLPNDVRDWRYEWAKQDVKDCGDNIPIAEIGYRLFDRRFIFYSGRARGVVGWPVSQIMMHYLRERNIGLLTSKAHRDSNFAHSFITDKPTEAIHFSATTGSNAMNFPLYLYPDKQDLDPTRRVNFDPKLHKKLQKLAKHPEHGAPDEVAIFDYIYGVLHCPAYRETYAEFLKIDFPRIPWPPSPDEFWDISAKGARLRKLHLMDPAAIGPTPFPFTGDGDGVIDKPRFEDGKIWINKTQYFDNAPEVSWGFYIGGYQPARKWLKDRKGRALGFEDVKHYQRILKILAETDRIMAEITMTLNA